MNRARIAGLAVKSAIAASIALMAVSVVIAQSASNRPSPHARSAAATSASQPSTGGLQPSDSRPAVALTGLGTFLYGDATLTAYGCFRTGTRVLCDFDLSKRRNAQLHAPWVWHSVELVDDGGKVTRIHNAFFVGQDGSQFPTASVGTDPVRMMMEYDDVSPNFSSVALVSGRNRIQGVPITPVDASQPAGTIPQRGGPVAQPTGTSKH
jgi:hypothetical protein